MVNEGATVVLGLGNVLCGDDGIGCRVVEYLYATHEFPAGVELLDGGTLGQELLAPVMRAARLLLVDCVDFGLNPGAVAVREGPQMPMWLGARKISPHQGSFAEVMALAHLKNSLPEQIILFGMQPENTAFGQPLSAIVRSRLGMLARMCLEQLRDWGLAARKREEKLFLNQTDLALQNYEKDFQL